MLAATPAPKVNGGVSKSTDDILEANIARTPLTVRSIEQVFKALDPEGKGYVPVELLKGWYTTVDFMGVDPTDREIDYAIKENIHTVPNGLTFEEFTIFILRMSRW